MPTYNKLVRDRIPEIIAASGRRPTTRTLDSADYLEALHQKLGEELQEYLDSGDLAELADLAEVLYAVVQAKGTNLADFEQLRLVKREARGGFAERLLLVETD